MRLPRLVVHTPVWKRYDLTEQMFHHTRHMARVVSDQADVDLVAIISEQRYVGICQKHGWRSVWAENLPLGRKGNEGMAWTGRNLSPDGVLGLGSDDFADETYFRAALEAMRRGVDLWGVRDIYFKKGEGGEIVHWKGYPPTSPRHGETLGAGRMLSRRFLDACSWAPWEPDQSRAMDASMLAKFRSIPGLVEESTTLGEIGATLLDVKTDESLTLWEKVVI